MSLILQMLHFNVPLSQWESYVPREHGGGFFSQKNSEKIAKQIFSQFSHERTTALVAKEFETLPMDIRIRIRTLCAEAPSSGNVRKGIQRLNTLMNGKLLKDVDDKTYVRTQTRDGFRQKEVRPEVAGATKKYQIVDQKKGRR